MGLVNLAKKSCWVSRWERTSLTSMKKLRRRMMMMRRLRNLLQRRPRLLEAISQPQWGLQHFVDYNVQGGRPRKRLACWNCTNCHYGAEFVARNPNDTVPLHILYPWQWDGLSLLH